MHNLKQQLIEGLNSLALDTPIEPLEHYLTLLHQWNKAYNLTAVRDIDAMVTRHIIDSLAILPWVKGPRILDVGTGGGLPGIPLAIAKPDWMITLLDSNGKKVRFLNEVKRTLGLKNVDIIQTRAEAYHPDYRFDTVTSRAFSELQQMIQWTRHLIAADGIWLAMKGRLPEAELALISQPYSIQTYSVEGLEGERCCVILQA